MSFSDNKKLDELDLSLNPLTRLGLIFFSEIDRSIKIFLSDNYAALNKHDIIFCHKKLEWTVLA